MTTINSKTVTNLINSLEEALESVQTEIENLEETYRKMLEEAKSSLDAQKEEMETQLAYWKVVRDNDGVVKKRKRRTRALEETPVATEQSVVDEQPEDEKVVDEETATEEQVNDALPFDDPENPEATEAVPEDMPTEIADAPQETKDAESDEGWGEKAEESSDDNGWGPFPQEW